MGDRTPGGAGPAPRNSSGVEAMAAATAADAAARMAAGGLRPDQRSVRYGQADPDVAEGVAGGMRDGRGAGRRADLPVHLRSGGGAETGEPVVDLVPDSGRDQARIRDAPARHGVRFAGGRRAGAKPGGLAGRDESLARVLADIRRGSLGGTRADADTGDAGGARLGDPAIRAGGLHRSGGDIPLEGRAERSGVQGDLAAGPVSGGPRQRVARAGDAAAGGRRGSGQNRRAGEDGRGGDRIGGGEDAADAAAAAVRPDRAAAACEPAVRVQRAEDAGHGAVVVREVQADQLSAHGQPAPVAGCGGDATEGGGGDCGAISRAPRAGDRRAAARSAARRRYEGHGPPRDYPDYHP